MATTPSNQIPLKFELTGKDGKVTQPWAFWFQKFQNNLPPIAGGAGYVIDGTASITGPTTMDQGPAVDRGISPPANSIFFAQDTGVIYTVNGGVWQEQSGALTGDITKPAFSHTTTLTNVGHAGTYGSGTQIPVFTTDDKGRVVSVSLVNVTPPAANVAGKVGDLIFKSTAGGDVAGAANIAYDPVSGNIFVSSAILFDDPVPTFGNLSPLTTKGDIIGFDGNINVRVPVGADGYNLVANSSTSTGLDWAPPVLPAFIEIPFNYGDASPKPLYTVPASKMVLNASIVIKTAFNGTGANLTIGSGSVPNDIMTAGDNAPGIISNWSVSPDTFYGFNTPVYLTINNGSGGTAGSGLVILQIQT